MNFTISKKQFDILIIGCGGAGLMAAVCAMNSGAKNIAVISKVIPNNSHTVAAKGGINAALANVKDDNWQWHAFDTLKGSDYLADIDAVEILCREANQAILDLEKNGMVFSRDSFGKIAQRAYGGQTSNFGQGEIAYRACYSKDKTGHTIFYTLYEQALKNDVKFFSEFFVSDLFFTENSCSGCLAIDINRGELVIFESKIIILATGGYSQIYQNTTSSLNCSGDGSGLVLAQGLALQDMEFVQFHPTGIFGNGFLITEAARGEGAFLLNSSGDRFMKNYAPKMMELASRDIISQAMATEIYQGRGAGKDKNFLHLDLRHLSDEVLNNKLPGVVELVKNFTRLDVKKDLIPVAPSAHYTMGGVPTNLDGEVLNNEKEVLGLMAIGEVACVSVHGANRLGCNSLLDLIVFGKIAGQKAAQKISQLNFKNIDEIAAKKIAAKKIADFEKIFAPSSHQNQMSLINLKKLLQENNEKNLGVFRDEKLLQLGFKKTKELFEIFKNYRIKNNSLLWNDEIISYFELKNLFLNSLATNFAALNRCESRGAHYRSDFPERDDKNFYAHSLVKISDLKENKLEFSLKMVRNVSAIPQLNLTFQSRKY
ncbi:MAG: FAD-binding protein [Rickettsiales bacterium]|nr:FAD-binding protein [Rickettsiales bacterium]